jgi:hypothetical protein
MVAIELHDFAKIGHHLISPPVVSDLKQKHMEGLVDFKEAVSLSYRIFKILLQGLDLCPLQFVRAGCHHAGCIGFEQSQ